MDWQEYWDPEDTIFNGFMTRSNLGIPNVVLIDRQGVIGDQRSGWGPFYYSSLKSTIGKLLNERTKLKVSSPRGLITI